MTQSEPVVQPLEIRRTEEMLVAGLDIFHLRKPDLTLADFTSWLSDVKPVLRKQISWHLPDCFRGITGTEGLRQAFAFSRMNDIHRIHFPAWWRNEFHASLDTRTFTQLFADYGTGNPWILSTSCHDLGEALLQLGTFDYVFLSPVFSSHSKKGYLANPALLNEVKVLKNVQGAGHLKRGQLIALGGLSLQRLSQVQSAGFDGVAMVGSLWSQAQLDQHIPYVKKCKLKFKCKWNK